MTDRHVDHPLEQWLVDIGAELIDDPTNADPTNAESHDDFDPDPWDNVLVEPVSLTIAQQDFLSAVATFPTLAGPRTGALGLDRVDIPIATEPTDDPSDPV